MLFNKNYTKISANDNIYSDRSYCNIVVGNVRLKSA